MSDLYLSSIYICRGNIAGCNRLIMKYLLYEPHGLSYQEYWFQNTPVSSFCFWCYSKPVFGLVLGSLKVLSTSRTLSFFCSISWKIYIFHTALFRQIHFQNPYLSYLLWYRRYRLFLGDRNLVDVKLEMSSPCVSVYYLFHGRFLFIVVQLQYAIFMFCIIW